MNMKGNYLLIGLSMVLLSFGCISASEKSSIKNSDSTNTTQITITCNADSTVNILRKNIAQGKATKIKTEITFPAGAININSSTKLLSEGVYEFSDWKWKPEISYTENGETGYLKIISRDKNEDKNIDNSDSCNWNIALNKDLTNELEIKFLAGEGNIDLRNCNIKRFDFEMLAGDVDINLCNTSVPYFIFKALAGEADIDLSGEWIDDLNADIIGGFGDITLTLPSKTGVKLNIIGVIGEIHAPGLKKEGKTYTNELYGSTKASLYIELKGGIGSINIVMVD